MTSPKYKISIVSVYKMNAQEQQTHFVKFYPNPLFPWIIYMTHHSTTAAEGQHSIPGLYHICGSRGQKADIIPEVDFEEMASKVSERF